MFRKVLVANRGEIAIRAFRAAYELGIRTVAVFPHEDRNSLHRLKADEAYEIGEPGHPVRAYLSVTEMIDAAARAPGPTRSTPGYGFLSENPTLAQACDEAGIVFVGPTAARAVAHRGQGPGDRRGAGGGAAGASLVGALRRRGPLRGRRAGDRLPAVREGGRRRRRARAAPGRRARPTCTESIEAAMREAESAFGDAAVFLTEAVTRPRHIEVQVLADAAGDVIHLFERDCSVQRRHQKVIEIAPAPNLDPALRERICADAVAFARQIGYTNAGTVEFLVSVDQEDGAGRHVFLEMNPRIQVEHTVTEEVTDVDLVQAQLRIAAGETWPTWA